MVKYFVFLFIQVFSAVSFSLTAEIENSIESRVREFFQIRYYSINNLNQLDRYNNLYKKYKILKNSCKIEIKLNELPINCFKWLNQLSALGLIEQNEWKILLSQFQHHCIQRSEKLDEAKILQGQKQIQESDCNDALSNRLRKLQYMKGGFSFDLSNDDLLE